MHEEDRLMKLIASGNQDAFNRLFDLHAGHLLGYATRFLKDSVKAEDIVQETWIKIVQLASHYKGQGHFIAWAFTMIRNQSLNELRKNSKLVFDDTVEFNNTDVSSTDPLSGFEIKSRFKSVAKNIESLPDTQRVAILLWAIEDLSYEDIASELNMSLAATKSLLFRARQTLKESQ